MFLSIKATRPLYYPDDRVFISRSVRQAAAHFRTSEEEVVRTTFPLVMRMSDRICVELRPKRTDLGGYLACYRAPGDQLIEEQIKIAPFGSSRSFPPLL